MIHLTPLLIHLTPLLIHVLFAKASSKIEDWKVGCKEAILNEGRKKLRCDKLYKKCAGNQWQQVVWNDESKFVITGSNLNDYLQKEDRKVQQ